MTQSVTLKDVAREAKLSVSAVSKAIGDYPQVSDDTRSRVLAICKKLNYPVDRRLRSSGGRSRSRQRQLRVSVVLVEPRHVVETDSYWLTDLAAMAAEQGIALHLSHLSRDTFESDLAQQAANLRKADGLLVFGSVTATVADRIRELDRPTVWMVDVIGQRLRRPDDHLVISDNHGMAYAAVSALIERGHRRLGFFCSSYEPGTWNELWLSALKLAQLHHDLPDDPADRPVFEMADKRLTGRAAAEYFSQMKELPTGWVCPAGLAAKLFTEEMAAAGRPIDIETMVFGGLRRSAKEMMIEDWPMVAPDFHAMARRALDTLESIITSPDLPPALTLVPHQSFNLDRLRGLT